MKTRIPDEGMPTLELSRDDELWIERKADAMVENAVNAFDAFRANGRRFPRDEWKRIKSKGPFDVYRTRTDFAKAFAAASTSAPEASAYLDTSSTSSSSSSSAMLSAPFRPAAVQQSRPVGKKSSKQLDFPEVVLTGVLPGTMEDAGYGAVAASEEIWRLRGSYVNDLQRACKIVATIKAPSLEDPFRFLGVKWSWRKLPAFVQQRDMVYAESTGVVGDDLAKCETGYTLMHSIELPGIPDLSQYGLLRMNLSMCYLIRKYDDASVEFYCRAFCIPAGKIPTRVAARIYADGLLAAVNTMECSYVKKLMWLTQQRRKRSITYTKRDLDSATHCQGCLRGLKLFGGLRRTASQCSCCKRIVCAACASARKVVLDVADDGDVTQRALPFCAQCVVDAKALPALTIALATVVTWHDEGLVDAPPC